MTAPPIPGTTTSPPCKLCGSRSGQLVETLRRKPERETDFGIPADRYLRSIYRCADCDVFSSHHDMLGCDFYRSQYNVATYQRNLAGTYDRIRALPESASDNKQRVRRVADYYASHARKTPRESRVLDVGSGLCVFLAELKELGFECHAIDPDPVAAEHGRRRAAVDYAYAGTLGSFPLADIRYDIITFNKVLEHVSNPRAMLSGAARYLQPDGVIYLELPDGDFAQRSAPIPQREEFYIEHETIFTELSMRWMIDRSGLHVEQLNSIHEPSDKYTLYAFTSRRVPEEWLCRVDGQIESN